MESYGQILYSAEKLGRVEIIGETELGYGIPLVHRGGKRPSALIIASVHAREHITTSMLNALVKRENENLSYDYLPVLNIDGVLLCQNGLGIIEEEERKKGLHRINNNSSDFSLWKANINGVDINVNFDADWGEGKSNITYPASANYIGRYPASEKETQAVVRLLSRNYPLVVCFHSKGEVVYWGYESNFRHYEEAKEIADVMGYPLLRSENSCGGIKDYYSTKYKGLGLTVEIGKDIFPHPYPISQLPNLVKQHKNTISAICDTGDKIGRKIYERSVD